MNYLEWQYPIYVFLVIYTILAYLGALWLFKKTKIIFLNPLILSLFAILLLLIATGIPYSDYKIATIPLDFMLGPTVVALGYAIYIQRQHLFKNFTSITISVIVGAFVGIVSVVGVLWLFGASPEIVATMMPKSVTNPIAIPLSESNGGFGSITSMVVIVTGIFGGIVGPAIFRHLKINSKIAKGLALGCAAHGIGTAKAMEIGAVEGAISGLAIGLMGLFTAILVPLISLLL